MKERVTSLFWSNCETRRLENRETDCLYCQKDGAITDDNL